MQKRTARLNIFLCNFQLHYYNSWKQPTTSNNNNKSGASQQTTNAASSASVERLSGTQPRGANKSSGLNSILSYFSGAASSSNKKSSGPLDHQMSTSSSNNLNNANNSSDYNFTEDLMQLFSVVNIRIQKVTHFDVIGNSRIKIKNYHKRGNKKGTNIRRQSNSTVDVDAPILQRETRVRDGKVAIQSGRLLLHTSRRPK